MRATRTPAVVLLGALLLTPLAGCGGGNGDDSAKKPSTPSTSRAAGEIAPKTFVADLLSAMKTKKSARMSISVVGGFTGVADVSYGASTDAKVSIDYGGQKLQVVSVAGNTYIQQSAGGKYVRVSADDPAMGAFVKALAFIGPREAVGAIAPGITRVRDQGVTGPGGIHSYLVSVDGKVAGQALAFGAADVPKSIDLTITTLDSGLPVMVLGKIGKQDVRITISHWGTPVHVVAPPANQLLNR